MRTQIAGARGQSNELVVPLPTRPDSGFAFVIYDGERQCYYDDGGKPFFLNSALAKATAAAAAKAAKEAASGQTDRLRAMAEADGGVAAAEYANKSLTDPNAQQSGGFFSKHPTTAPPAPAPAPAPAPRRRPRPRPRPRPRRFPDLAAGGDRGAYDRALKEESNPFNNTVGIPAGTTPYERCVSDPNNPFRGYAEKLAAERLAAAATMATAAPPAPAPMFVPPRAGAGADARVRDGRADVDAGVRRVVVQRRLERRWRRRRRVGRRLRRVVRRGVVRGAGRRRRRAVAAATAPSSRRGRSTSPRRPARPRACATSRSRTTTRRESRCRAPRAAPRTATRFCCTGASPTEGAGPG